MHIISPDISMIEEGYNGAGDPKNLVTLCADNSINSYCILLHDGVFLCL